MDFVASTLNDSSIKHCLLSAQYNSVFLFTLTGNQQTLVVWIAILYKTKQYGVNGIIIFFLVIISSTDFGSGCFARCILASFISRNLLW